MSYLQELTPQRFYDRWDYLRVLRALLPRGVLWQIPLPDEVDIQPMGILSLEAFGRTTISTGDVYITPNGIVSSEAFGVPYILRDQEISPVGIVSEEALGTPSLIFGQVISSPAGIVSQEDFGIPTVNSMSYVSVGSIVSGEIVSDAGVWRDLLIYDDFDGGSLNPNWADAFKNNWDIETESGETIAQSDYNYYDKLYPRAPYNLKAGELEIHFGFWRSTGGLNSVHTQLLNTSNVLRVNCEFYNGNIIGINGGIFAMSSGPSEQRMKIVRNSSNILWAYFWNGSAWIREDAWSTPGSYISNNENLWVRVNGGTGENGFSYIYITGTLI